METFFSNEFSATLAVTSPNGGESWGAGSSHNITWTTTGTIANVKIEYSTNNGTAWTTIIASTPNTGTYGWTVPNVPSASCLVRISDAAIVGISDVSNAVFTINAGLPPTIGLGKTNLVYGAVFGSTSTAAQSVVVSNTGGGTLNWTAASNETLARV